jgi:hypothetical protein
VAQATARRRLTRIIAVASRAIGDARARGVAMTKDPHPRDAPDPHEQAIVDAFMEAVNADSPRDAGEALKRHPELLTADTLAFLDDVMAHQNDEIQEATGPFLDLLERAIAIGMDPAVREVEEAIANEEARPPSVGLETPAGFEADVDALVKLTDRAKTDPKLHRERVAFIQKLLARSSRTGRRISGEP